MRDADDGPDVERVARAQHGDRQRAAQAREAAADLVRGQVERLDLHGSAAVVASAWGASPAIVSRNGTGMKIATNTDHHEPEQQLAARGQGLRLHGRVIRAAAQPAHGAHEAVPDEPRERRAERDAEGEVLAVARAHLEVNEVHDPEEDAHAHERHHAVQALRELVVAVAEVRRRHVAAVELADGEQVNHRHQQAGPPRVGRRVEVDVLLAVRQPEPRRGVLEPGVEERVALERAVRRAAGPPSSGRGRR